MMTTGEHDGCNEIYFISRSVSLYSCTRLTLIGNILLIRYGNFILENFHGLSTLCEFHQTMIASVYDRRDVFCSQLCHCYAIVARVNVVTCIFSLGT